MPTTATSRRLHEVAGPVILSGYASELYDGLFGDWHQVQLSPWSDNVLA